MGSPGSATYAQIWSKGRIQKLRGEDIRGRCNQNNEFRDNDSRVLEKVNGSPLESPTNQHYHN